MYEKFSKEAHSWSYDKQFRITIIRKFCFTYEPGNTNVHILTGIKALRIY